jgi:hypothetical protein
MKHLALSICFAVVVILGVGQVTGEGMSYSTVFHQLEKPAQAQAVPVYHRGMTDLQGQPCVDARGGHYQSELISRREHVDVAVGLGIPLDHADILAAIARAESGNQLNCFGDDVRPYIGERTSQGSTWGPSYGVFQIRTIVEHAGKGDCRDIERLRNNLVEQTKCGWEISQHGKTYRAWSVVLNGKYKQWLGKDW